MRKARSETSCEASAEGRSLRVYRTQYSLDFIFSVEGVQSFEQESDVT